jgi:hypothetical protein
MATQVQFRRGTTTQNNAFTGANGEFSVDTDVKTIRLHDGVTGGGAAIMMNTTTAQTALNKTFSTGSVWTGNSVALAYGGTGSSLTAVQGAVPYCGASGFGLSAAGTSGQVLISGGTGSPVWVNASSLTTGTATVAVTATNIAGGSAGQLVIQSDTGLSSFITAGDAGTFLQSAGAGYSPTWAAGQVTLGTSAVPLGGTATTLAALTSITMQNGSYGGGTVGNTITGSGPWTATITGISSTTGINVGQNITATPGTGSLFGGSPTSVVVASVVSGTSITVTVTGGTTPTAGTITSITTFGYLQVPVGTTAQRPWVAATGMIRYNSTTVGFEGYSSGAWSSLGGVSSVDKFTYIRAESSAGASNGELEFFVENTAGNAAQKAMGITKDGVTIAGNLTVQGTTVTVNSTIVSYADSIIDIHNPDGNGALTTDDGKDIGIRLHYYKTSDKEAALVLANDTQEMEFYADGTETSGVFSGTYGTFKGNGFNFKDLCLEEGFTGTTSSTTATAIYAFSSTVYRTGELTMQVKNGTAYRVLKLMFVHDGTTVTLSENYLTGTEIQTAATNTTFTATIASNVLTVYATAASGTTVVKGKSTLFKA